MVPKDGYLLIDGDADFSGNLKQQVSRVSRRLQSEFIPVVANESEVAAANERFYSLIEKVYIYKIENGELDLTNYGNMFSAVEDIMKPVNNETTNNNNTNWDQDMKDTQQQVITDFKTGLLKWKDISLPRIQTLWTTINETNMSV